MKGAVWQFWIFGTVAFFIAIMIYFTMTPFFNTLTDVARTTGNFTTTGVNISFHNMLTRNANLWNLWPIAVGALVYLIFFVAASEEDELQRVGRF